MTVPLSRRLGQAFGLASCPISYLTSTALLGRGLASPVFTALITLSALWAATELYLGLARPATRPVANAKWVKWTRALWLLGPWVSWVDAREGWTGVVVAPSVQLALVALGATGLGLRVAAVLRLGTHFTYDHSVGEPGTLQTTGVYRLLRHPAYAGLLILTNFLGVLLGSLPGALVLASTVPNVLQRIDVEERELLRAYGDAYRTYQSRRARLIPFLF